ncbi:hypothetical protein L1049_013502 [Liquidambar formosana]|uniref:Uncharacterized protein n=1 Tax=Liquidambar formosana TaxID=63359 RepID=A0AAP0WYJ4_LIQFO
MYVMLIGAWFMYYFFKTQQGVHLFLYPCLMSNLCSQDILNSVLAISVGFQMFYTAQISSITIGDIEESVLYFLSWMENSYNRYHLIIIYYNYFCTLSATRVAYIIFFLVREERLRQQESSLAEDKGKY